MPYQNAPNTLVEVLIPDFDGISEHMHTLAQSNPFVIAQKKKQKVDQQGKG